MKLDPHRPVGFESRKAYARRCHDGFWTHFVRGSTVIDIGFRGGLPDAVPLFEGAIGVELGFPGYDGLHLPFDDGWADCVYASHVLEHVKPPDSYLREWVRVIRTGGTLILMLPHAYLYERRLTVPPSRWSGEHLRAYTPASLLTEIERSLEPNTYRVRHLADNDADYDYMLPLGSHPTGSLEIECVIEKLNPPTWRVEP